MVAVALSPARIVSETGLTLMVKSVNWNLAVVGRINDLLVAVMLTVKVPAAVELQDNEAVCGGVRLDGVIAPQVRPAGRGVSDSETASEKPFTPVSVIVEVAEPTIATGEVAPMVKSTTFTVTVVE
jgi:hypothetical protein